jgi:hypothetical protein
VKLPRHWARVVAPLILGGALASFLLQWLTVSADLRRAEATGVELVSRDVHYSGSYVHQAWRGEVEGIVEDAELWALPTFVAIALALALVLVPIRSAWWAGLVATAVSLILVFLWIQSTSSAFKPPIPDRHWGVWVALTLLPLAMVPIFARLLEPLDDPEARRGPEWLGSARREI